MWRRYRPGPQDTLAAAIENHVGVAGAQGWLDVQMILALIFLKLVGGDGLEDLERLEQDAGFATVMRALEGGLLSRAARRTLTWPPPDHAGRRRRQHTLALLLSARRTILAPAVGPPD